MKKSLLLMAMLLASVFLATNAFALYVEGGDALTQADADDILDIVFVFDTSYSMQDEITTLVPAMQNIVNNIDCPDCDVWVRATLMGINSSAYGLGENAISYVLNAAGSPVSDHSEDNAPAVEDMVHYYNWNDDATPAQDYYKAIVTLGDEGTENGYEPSGIDSADWAAAYRANMAAVDDDVMVFSVVGTPWPSYAGDEVNRDAVFSALAVGGSGFGYDLEDTGGTFIRTAANTIEADIEAIICTAAGGGTGGGDPVPEPTTMLLLGTGLAGLVCARRKKSIKK